MPLVLMVGWVPAIFAAQSLWRRNDVGYVEFALWVLLLLLSPWAGAILYAAWALFPRVSAIAPTLFGALCLCSVMYDFRELVWPALDWEKVAVETMDLGYQYEWQGGYVSPRYTYRYRGQRYTGSRVDLGDPRWSESAFEQHGPPYHAFVDPQHPDVSVLQRTLHRSDAKAGALGLAALAAGIGQMRRNNGSTTRPREKRRR